MASRATRRIALNHRVYLAMSLLALSTHAHAGWENTRYCRLGDDRVLIIAGNQRFVLTHSAAWELVDPAQRDSFTHLLSKEKLSKDLGILVSTAPIDHEVPLAGEVDATGDSAGTVSLVFKLKTGDSKPIKVSAEADGGKLDSTSTFEFNQVAKLLGKPPSTLLVSLADKNGQLSASKAWGLVLERLSAKPEFFAFIDKKQGLLWVRKTQATQPTTDALAKPSSSEGSAVEPKTEKPKTDQQPTDPTTAVIVGVASVVLGGGLGFFVGRRLQQPSPVTSEPPKFKASTDEIELVEKARSEVAKLNWPPDRVPSAEEVIVGQIIDRYNRFPTLHEEVEKLRSYQKFKEAHDLFQAQIDKAVAESKASHRKSEEIAALLHLERAKTEKTSGELQVTSDRLSAANAELKKTTARISDLERSNEAFQQKYSELTNRTAAVCHDLVLNRPRGDAWALAFVYLVDYSLSYLGLARQCNDQRMFDGMISNLYRLSDAMSKAFPDRKLVIDPWQRSVKAMGDSRTPSYDTKPHPHVDSLSQILLTVRETGPSLAELREFYAPSESGLHIIRPA